MRKLVICFALAFALLAPLAAAKTALYVTKDNCARLTCDCLTGNDKLFCERVRSLGYEVIINTEGDARDSSSIWKEDSRKADMIFLGDASDSVLNKTQSAFCGNIIASGKKIFATGSNAYIGNETTGCAFRAGLASYSDEDNVCTADNVFIRSSNYVTKMYNLNSIVKAYATAAPMYIHSGPTWIGVHCDPPGSKYQTETYSVMNLNDKGAFWGLGDAASLSPEGWQLFDRALIYTMNDSVWSVATKTIPEHVSSGEKFIVASRIYDRGQPVTTGNVTLAINDRPSGNMAYNPNSGQWEITSEGITADSTIRVVALEGESRLSLKAGNISVRIISGSYQPGNYTLRATASEDATLTYRIWDSKLGLKREGAMAKEEGSYQAVVAMGDWGDVILEVDATANGKEGGAMKKVTKGEAVVFGTGYRIAPKEWVASATKETTTVQKFRIISMSSAITGLNVRVGGSIGGRLSVNTTGMSTSLAPGEETSFTAEISTNSLEEGYYSGTMIVDSEQTYYVMPVNFTYSKVAGDFLDVSPTEWSVVVGAGREAAGKFTLKNLANFPASGIGYSFTGDLAGMATAPEEPYYVPGLGTAEAVIKVSGLSEGAYEGGITITSSAGTAKIRAVVRVTKDVFSLAEQALGELDAIDASLGQIGSPAQLAGRSLDLRNRLRQAENYWSAGEFAAAEEAYNSAVPELAKLKEDTDIMLHQPPYGLIAAAAAVMIAIAAGALFLRKRAKKKPEEKKEEKYEAPEEGGYRKEFY
ncbi:MAG: hypothetical protein QXU82_01965 [Candidatus Aenigmatarchaeota archaeon]